jgi:hypothetical protein
MTLLEFLVAITISTVVITLSFTVFSGILRGFLSQTNLTQTAGDIIVAKKLVDACFSDIVSIKECTDKSITCMKSAADSFVVIQFAKDSLRLGSAAVCGNLKAFAFSLTKKEPAGPWVLLWEARHKKGNWFSGAISGGQ